MNLQKIVKSKCLFFILSRSNTTIKTFVPPGLEPGTYPFLRRQVPLIGLKSYDERILEIENAKNGFKLDPVNIGMQLPKESNIWKNEKSNDLEVLSRKRQIIIDSYEIDYLSQNKKSFILQKFNIASYFNLFNDLFHFPHYFYPIINFNVHFNIENDEFMPVYHGNLISPFNAISEPIIHFDCEDSSTWTIVMTSPDEHLEHNDKEYVHWMVSNIVMKGGNVVNMDCIVPYLQPIPYLGTGFHRYVFVLYKQESGKINLSEYNKSENCLLEERTFSSYEFLKNNQDNITPVGISFFQASWDHSVRECFRNKIKCLEPIFEYNWPKLKLKPMKEFPENEEMHTYFDQYRDVKDIQEEVLKERLKTVNPFTKHERLKYPLAVPEDPDEFGFVKEKRKDKELRRNQWKQMDINNDL